MILVNNINDQFDYLARAFMPKWISRLDILKIHSRKINLTRCINLSKIAELISGAVGACMYALREHRVHVTREDFEMAVAKVMQKDSEKNMAMEFMEHEIYGSKI